MTLTKSASNAKAQNEPWPWQFPPQSNQSLFQNPKVRSVQSKFGSLLSLSMVLPWSLIHSESRVLATDSIKSCSQLISHDKTFAKEILAQVYLMMLQSRYLFLPSLDERMGKSVLLCPMVSSLSKYNWLDLASDPKSGTKAASCLSLITDDIRLLW